MAMFSGARSQSTTSGGNLVEFKAGRCKMESGSGPTKRKVVAEKEKGLVYVKQSQDQLIHFCWKNRETGALVDDLIIFPGDTEFKEVNGCNDGQVFMLKFKSSDDRRLFWAQDSVLDKELVTKVNDALNKPPSSTRINARGGSSERVSAPEPAGFGSGEELGALGGLDQRQLMQLLQFMTPNSGGGEAALQNILGGNGGGSEASGGSERGNESQFAEADQIAGHLQRLLGNRQRGSRAEVDLADVTTGERVVETVRNNSERLQAHVPQNEDIPPSQELIDTIHSPMLRQASSTFGHALQTGQMGPVLEQFGINSEAKEAAQKGDLLEFAKKLTEAEQKEQGTSAEEAKEPVPKKGKPGDDQMELD